MSLPRRWTHLSPSSASVPNTTNPYLHPYQSPNDPRSSSTASLLPPPSAVEAIRSGESNLRTLLCVFIHGFVGDETSFRGFPAHFHELLTILVQDTHVVHTKVYPKFKTRDKISIAVDNFSRWLSQFTSSTTDIVLLGHSMGGLLAADAVLLQPFPPGRHRILGTISFDTPFIGIHPGVIKSGLASIFSPAEKPLPDPSIPENLYGSARTSYDSEDTASIHTNSTGTTNSYGTSTFFPPTVKPKKSAWQSGMDFFRKHQGGLRRAAMAYVNGHLEFSGALMDFVVMKRRYQQIKALDRRDIEDRRRLLFGESGREHGVWVPRVRFANYFTVSTGRIKREKSQTRGTPGEVETPGGETVPPISPLPEAVVPVIVEGEATPPPPVYSPGPNAPAQNTEDKHSETVMVNGLSPASGSSAQVSPSYAELRKKEKTFCIIPREQDECWVKVMMENVDEVGAHCGLFFINGVPGAVTPPEVGTGQLGAENIGTGSPGKEEVVVDEVAEGEVSGGGAYEKLLGDVAQRIEGWVREWMDDLTVNPWILDEGR
ncbi:hypothetical protein TWF506_009665 [Arthrobotrys conoides]|uniref:DUF676 domain-containing protein n=1 Tax=Arthrobotrys conoides TaxID=74498 RepID=A0AAN8N2L5_9PEZI